MLCSVGRAGEALRRYGTLVTLGQARVRGHVPRTGTSCSTVAT